MSPFCPADPMSTSLICLHWWWREDSADAGRLVDRPALTVALDDGLAERDVPQAVRAARHWFVSGDDGVMERDELALERAVIGDDLLVTPCPGRARVAAFGHDRRWLVAKERRRERQGDPAIRCV